MKKKIAPQGVATKARVKKKGGGPTQRTPQRRIQIMGPTGKLRMEWRPW